MSMRETRQLTIDDAQAIVNIYSHIRSFKYKSIPEEKYIRSEERRVGKECA